MRSAWGATAPNRTQIPLLVLYLLFCTHPDTSEGFHPPLGSGFSLCSLHDRGRNIPGSFQQGVWGSSDHPKPCFPWSLPDEQRIPSPARVRCCYSWLSPPGFFRQVRSLLAGCFAPGVHTSTWAVCLCQIRGAAWCRCFYLSGEASDEQSVGGTSRAGLGRAGGRPGCFSWVRLAAGVPGFGEGLG